MHIDIMLHTRSEGPVFLFLQRLLESSCLLFLCSILLFSGYKLLLLESSVDEGEEDGLDDHIAFTGRLWRQGKLSVAIVVSALDFLVYSECLNIHVLLA